MPNIDNAAQAGLNVVLSGVTVGADLLSLIFTKLSDKMEKAKLGGNPFVENANTKQGKQNLKNLIEKHKEGVIPLQDNLSKEEMKSFQKEFKDMGVDFSVRKIGEDSYSVFFAGKDSESIEKAILNAIEKKSIKLEKQENKQLNKEKRIDKKEAKSDFKSGRITIEQLRTRQKEIDKAYKKDKPKEHKHTKSL